MKRWLRWLYLLSKRLYKRGAFLAVLALIPLAVLALQVAAQAKSGFVHVVLAQTDPADSISSALVDRFMTESSLVLFTYAEDARTATDMVAKGEADAAWIFSDGMEERLDRFVASRYEKGGLVTVVEREQTVLSRLIREKLNFALQEHTSRVCYLRYTRDNIEALNALSDEQLLQYYDEVEFNEDLFLYRTPDGTVTAQTNNNYLLAPVRGLLGVLVVLCGLAAALFYLQDESRGTFALVPLRRRGVVAFACLIVAVLNVSAVTLVALSVGGVATFWVKELGILLLYAVCCGAFCLLVMRLCRSIRTLAAVLPMLIVAMIALCPVFFDLRNLGWIQLLFPPTYFVNAAYDGRYLLYMIGYTLVCLTLAWGVERLIACLHRRTAR